MPLIRAAAVYLQHFLAAERQTAASIGYDRPSPKLLAFLRKHYGKPVTCTDIACLA